MATRRSPSIILAWLGHPCLNSYAAFSLSPIVTSNSKRPLLEMLGEKAAYPSVGSGLRHFPATARLANSTELAHS